MMKAGIMGATGYAGGELARLLLQRDDVEITWYGSKSYVGQKYASVFKNMVQFADDAWMIIWKRWQSRSMSYSRPHPRDSVRLS